ncbi:hypothetical protein GW17_00054217 [Ensete ventricosum]|nr:hypothetical protein GW17_00054217 [Ensete ventricosum]
MALRLPAVPNESKPFCLTSLRVGIDAYDSRSMHVDRCTPVEGAYPRASVSIAVGSRSGTHGKKLRARLVIRLAKPAFNPSCGHVTCRHWTTCGFCTYLYPMPTCRAFVSWLFGSCTSELASSYFTCHGSLVTIDGTCIPLTCLMMGVRLYRTASYGPKFLIGTVPVPDDVVCGVLTIVAPSRPYLRQSGYACVGSNVPTPGRPYLLQGSHAHARLNVPMLGRSCLRQGDHACARNRSYLRQVSIEIMLNQLRM